MPRDVSCHDWQLASWVVHTRLAPSPTGSFPSPITSRILAYLPPNGGTWAPDRRVIITIQYITVRYRYATIPPGWGSYALGGSWCVSSPVYALGNAVMRLGMGLGLGWWSGIPFQYSIGYLFCTSSLRTCFSSCFAVQCLLYFLFPFFALYKVTSLMFQHPFLFCQFVPLFPLCSPITTPCSLNFW